MKRKRREPSEDLQTKTGVGQRSARESEPQHSLGLRSLQVMSQLDGYFRRSESEVSLMPPSQLAFDTQSPSQLVFSSPVARSASASQLSATVPASDDPLIAAARRGRTRPEVDQKPLFLKAHYIPLTAPLIKSHSGTPLQIADNTAEKSMARSASIMRYTGASLMWPHRHGPTDDAHRADTVPWSEKSSFRDPRCKPTRSHLMPAFNSHNFSGRNTCFTAHISHGSSGFLSHA